MKKNILLLIIAVILTGGIIVYIVNPNDIFNKKDETLIIPKTIENTNDFNVSIIRAINTNSNYILSPYSLEVALNMLRDGANGTSQEEIANVLSSREMKDLRVKDKIGIANAAFIKKDYKDLVKRSYYNTLNNQYHAEIIYDDFKDPTIINDWVKKNTNDMIEKIIDQMDPDFAMGLINAVAIDVKWESPFECINTTGDIFTMADGEKIQTEMMHKTFKYSGSYFNNEEVEGIIIPYETFDNSDVALEFVAMLPKGNLSSFISGITQDKLNNIDINASKADEKYNIRVALPRFSYEYSVNNLIDILRKMGIKEVFEKNADLSNIFDNSPNKFYVNQAIHKAKIELNEKGTKAAALTFFAIAGNALVMEPPKVQEINFDRPFAYLIRDAKSKEIMFFGSVYEPNLWNGSTCDNEM